MAIITYCSFITTSVNAQNSDENYVKSSYILNFIEETTWPNEQDLKTYKIAILGNEPIFDNLQKLSKKLTVKGKPFTVSYHGVYTDIKDAHVVHVSPKYHGQISNIKKNVKNCMIVTDEDDVQHSTMIYFYVNDEDRIQFKLNLGEFEKANLSPSTKLLLYGGEKKEAYGILEQTERDLQAQLLKLQERDKLIKEKEEHIKEKEEQINKLAEQISEKESSILLLKNDIDVKQSTVEDHELTLVSLRDSIRREKKIVQSALKDLQQIEEKNVNKQDTLLYYQNLLSKKVEEIAKNNAILERQNQKMEEQTENLSNLDTKLQKSQQNLWLAFSIVAIFLVVVFFLYRENATKKRLLNIIEEKNAKVMEASVHKDEFIANLSHEVRTPLNAIAGYTNLLLSKFSNEKNKPFLQKVLMSSNNLLAIINDILDLSKIESGKIEFESINFDLPLMLNNTFDSLVIMAEAKDLKYIIDIDENIPEYVNSDPTRINQVLINLLSNAIKFTDEGFVIFKVELVETIDNKSSILFSVKDSGKGISPDMQEEIFESFSQEEASTTRKYGGTGLGLTISQKIITLMDSTINLVSEPNKGSDFSFILYLEKAQTSRSLYSETNYIEVDELLSKKVIIADDEQLNRDLFLDQFAEWNPDLQVDVARDGQELVDLVAKNNYDLVLTDVRMPRLNGIDATKQIKNMDPKIVIIGVSANAIDNDIKECLNAGMNDYVTKPINFNNLLITIAKQLELSYNVVPLDSAETPQIEQVEEEEEDESQFFYKIKRFSDSEEEFEKSKKELIEEIDLAIKNASENILYKDTHSLLNKIIYVNDEGLLEIARELEINVKSENTDQVKQSLEKIAVSWNELKDKLV